MLMRQKKSHNNQEKKKTPNSACIGVKEPLSSKPKRAAYVKTCH